MTFFSTPYRIGEELTVTARDLLDLPEHVHLRMVDSAAGGFGQTDGRWPIIGDIRPYDHVDTGESLILVAVADEPPEFALLLKPNDFITVVYSRTNIFQERALLRLCEDRDTPIPYEPYQYRPAFDLPDGYVAGWVGPIYVGCDPEGRISS